MRINRASGLRKVADNLDLLADRAEIKGHIAQAEALRQNAAFLRKTADLETHLETLMGKFADKIHAVEKERDDAKAQLIAAQTALSQAGEAKTQLDALTTAGKVADDADVAALTDDPENATPAAPSAPAPVDPATPATRAA